MCWKGDFIKELVRHLDSVPTPKPSRWQGPCNCQPVWRGKKEQIYRFICCLIQPPTGFSTSHEPAGSLTNNQSHIRHPIWSSPPHINPSSRLHAWLTRPLVFLLSVIWKSGRDFTNRPWCESEASEPDNNLAVVKRGQPDSVLRVGQISAFL